MKTDNNIRYTYSGHESFYCRSLWLKKGYDFIQNGHAFNSSDAVIHLGVGRNMTTSIRYWMRAFGLFDDSELTEFSHYLFHSVSGKDKFIEDLGTKWLLHYYLVNTNHASLYNMFFTEFQKEKNKEFTRDELQVFVKRKNDSNDYSHLYSENTVRKDIGVLLQSYLIPINSKSHEDYSSLLIDLNLIRQNEDRKYYFNRDTKSELNPLIFLYAILDRKRDSNIVSFDELMELALIFLLTSSELIEIITELLSLYPNSINYTDDGGIKQMLFFEDSPISKTELLNKYYS